MNIKRLKRTMPKAKYLDDLAKWMADYTAKTGALPEVAQTLAQCAKAARIIEEPK